MAVAIRNQIQKAIQAALREIKTASGYSQTVRVVQRRNPNKATVDANAQPAIYLWGSNEPLDHVVDPLLNHELELNVLFLCPCTSAETQEETGVEFYTDVRNRLMALSPLTLTVGGNELAVNIRPLGARVLVDDERAQQAGGHAIFTVEYPTAINDGRAAL